MKKTKEGNKNQKMHITYHVTVSKAVSDALKIDGAKHHRKRAPHSAHILTCYAQDISR